MDVRASLNASGNTSVVAENEEKSFIDDSFYAKVPPMAASTVMRAKASSRRLQEQDPLSMGSFIQDPAGDPTEDWASVRAWCADLKPNPNDTGTDKSSLGILDVDEMDFSTNHLLTPDENSVEESRSIVSMATSEGSSHDTDSKPDPLFARSHSQIGGTVVKKASTDTKPVNKKFDTLGIRQSLFGQLPIGEEEDGEGEVDSSVYDVDFDEGEIQELDKDFGEMECSLAGYSDEDDDKTPKKQDSPYVVNIEHSAAARNLDSRYFRPGTSGLAADPDGSTTNKHSYLSKVSLFDDFGNSDASELDTEDELDMARRNQGARLEAAGEASLTQRATSRPGLEGGCSDESRTRDSGGQLPITQRQSAEGDTVASPVLGDGGGGGDGSSGSESDTGRARVNDRHGSRDSRYPYNPSGQSQDHEEHRIRPMGDDLLSEMRSSRYATNGVETEDSRLQSRYLQPISYTDDPITNDNFNIDEFLSGRNSVNGNDDDFDPGDRLEASGFNADDISLSGGQGSNQFGGVMMSSFGSFGVNPTGGDSFGANPSGGDLFGANPSGGDTFGAEADSGLAEDDQWQELQVSTATSGTGSKKGSIGSNISRNSSHQRYGSLEVDVTGDRDVGVGERKATPGSSPGAQGETRGSGTRATDISFSSGQTGTLSSSAEQMMSVKSGKASDDSGVFKKPVPPPPRSGMKLNIASSSSRKQSAAGVKGSREKVNLELRASFSDRVAEQQEGLKRVPSLGNTTVHDLTIYDDEFFDFGDAKAMLNNDEVEFNKENIFRQDEVMPLDGSGENPCNDSWMYQSVKSISRPSWMADPSEEEEVHIRISVGTYMAGRTEALGSLGGDDNVKRPEFGRPISSPTRESKKLAEVEEEDLDKTVDGVEFNEGYSTLKDNTLLQSYRDDYSQSVRTQGDATLTLSLLDAKTPEPSRTRPIQSADTSVFDMNHISMLMKGDSMLEDYDPKKMTQRLVNFGLSKQYKGKDQKTKSTAPTFKTPTAFTYSSTKPITSSTTTAKSLPVTSSTTTAKSLPVTTSSVSVSESLSSSSKQKSPRSKLPLKKGSNLSWNFPKVSDSQSSLLKSQSLPKKSDLDSDFNRMKENHERLLQKFDAQADNLSKLSEEGPNPRDLRGDSQAVRGKDSRVPVENPKSPIAEERQSPKWRSPNKSSVFDTSLNCFRDNEDLSFMLSNQSSVSQSDFVSFQAPIFDSRPSANGARPKNPFDGERLNTQSVSSKPTTSSVSSFSRSNIVDGDRETPPADGQVSPVQTLPQSNFNYPVLNLEGDNNAGDGSRFIPQRILDGQQSSGTSKRISSSSHSYTTQVSEVSDSHKGNRNTARPLQGKDGDKMVTHKSVPCSTSGGSWPGHHIPDGTEYSERSDYSHMNHKGMSREALVGTDDIGLAESRGFDAIRGQKIPFSLNSRDERQHQISDGLTNQSSSSSERVSEKYANSLSSDHSGNNRQSGVSSKIEVSKHIPSSQLQSSSISTSKSSLQSVAVQSQRSMTSVSETTSCLSPGSQRSMETQTQTFNQSRHETATQTPIMTIRNQRDNHPELDNVAKHLQFTRLDESQAPNNDLQPRSNDGYSSGYPSSVQHGPPPPLTSFKHNLLPSRSEDPNSKPRLLSKESLLNSEFAKEFLNRDSISLEVREQIYAANLIPRARPSHDVVETNSNFLHHEIDMDRDLRRDSSESLSNWTMLKENSTLENTTSTQFDYTQQPSQWAPSNHSTPMVKDTQFFTTPSNMHTLLSTGQKIGGHLPENKHGGGQQVLRSVEVTDRLEFSEVCCIGISRNQILRLTNPTDVWLECIIQVGSITVDGLNSAIDNSPFKMHRKVIIGPLKSEEHIVIFLPKRAGTYVAEVEVLSQLFLRQQHKDAKVFASHITIHAKAEEPKLEVTVNGKMDENIDFGDLTWGTCREKTLKLYNKGKASVPVRLSISSKGAWHCFAFEPEGRASDVSIISGQRLPSQNHGRSIINLTLPGSSDRFNFYEIKVWCQPPFKTIDKALAQLSPEKFSCWIDIELDIPHSLLAKIYVMKLLARVGVHKLHIQAGLKEMRLKESPGKSCSSDLQIHNAGNLDLDLAFAFSDFTEILTITPAKMTLPPQTDTQLKVKCAFPRDCQQQKYEALLLMLVQSDGGMYELKVTADVIPRALPTSSEVNILCDKDKIDFGEVNLGKQRVMKYRLLQKEATTLDIKTYINGEGFSFVDGPEPVGSGHLKQEIRLEPNKITQIYVMFTPSTLTSYTARVNMKVYNIEKIYKVHLNGRGRITVSTTSAASTTDQRPLYLDTKQYSDLQQPTSVRSNNSKSVVQQHQLLEQTSVIQQHQLLEQTQQLRPSVIQKDILTDVLSNIPSIQTSNPRFKLLPVRLGDLEVSRSLVQFPNTSATQVSEEVLMLKNLGTEMLQWMFSSFAPPYLRKTSDKTTTRLSYKVFDFSHQFGKLSGHSTMQLSLKFMPRCPGLYTQYWDVQTTSHTSSSTNDFIQIQLSGEATEEPEGKVNRLRMLENITNNGPEKPRLTLEKDTLIFSEMSAGREQLLKIEIKNLYNENVLLTVSPPRLPFYIKHQKVEVARRRYLRYPIEFQPQRPGRYTDLIKFRSSLGDDLILRLEGECI